MLLRRVTRPASPSPDCPRRSARAVFYDELSRFRADQSGSSKLSVNRELSRMHAYAGDGKIICFFQPAQKFKSRYATFGFSDKANLDDGTMWPATFALTELTAADEARIGELVKNAVS